MRVKLMLVVLLCGLSSFAMADSITQISPTSFTLGSPEVYLTIDGNGLTGTDTTFIEYDGPAGTIVVEPTGGTSTQLVSFVPIPVVNTAGTYSVTVLATDICQNTRAIRPATI